MIQYDLPRTVTISDIPYEIRSDYRDVLDVIEILTNKNLNNSEKTYLELLYFYPDYENIPQECYQEALEKCRWFIDCGREFKQEQEDRPKLVDWGKDFPYIVAPINQKLGKEIREPGEPLHWWTFVTAYMEMGDCTFAHILKIRDLLSRGKPLDKQDAEWYKRNKDIVDLDTMYTKSDDEFFDFWMGK